MKHSKIAVVSAAVILFLFAALLRSQMSSQDDTATGVVLDQPVATKSPPSSAPTRLGQPLVTAPPSTLTSMAAQSNGSIHLRMDGLSSSELLAHVREAFSTTDQRVIAAAERILDACINHVQQLGGIDLALPPTLNAEQVVAAQSAQLQLRKRCSQLTNIRLDDLLRKHRQWQDLLSSDGYHPNDRNVNIHHGTDSKENDASLKRLRELIETDGEAVLFWANDGLREAIEANGQQKRLPPESPLNRKEDLWAALELARCSLGYPCGTNSLRSLLLCSRMGICGDSIQNAVLSQFSSADEKNLILAQRDLIVLAIRDRRFELIGF